MLSKLRCITVREEISVDFLELLDLEMAARTVFYEAFVPLLKLIFTEFRLTSEVRQDLGLELTVLFPHAE